LQGVRTAVTDAEGIYRFRNLPPGADYKVEATLSGFRTATQEAIYVFLGQEGAINLTLSPAGVAEAVTVTASSPLVDVTDTSTGVNITSSQFDSLPTARNFQQLTTIAPGVTLEMGDHDSRLGSSPTVGASSAPENNYIIDGISSTDPRYGTSGTNLTMNFVQEVQVLTGGYQAEYGRSTGGVFNVVTKSGGNNFHGDVFNYYRNKDWSPGDVERRRNKELVTFADQVTNWDFGASLGGPIVQDKLWFFGAIDPNRRTTYVGGQVEAGETIGSGTKNYDTDADIYAGKLTWTMNPSNTFVVTAFGDPTERNGWLTSPNADESAAIRAEKLGSHNAAAKYTGMITSTWLVDAMYGRHQQRSDLGPGTELGRNVPRQIDETLGAYQHGGFQRYQNDSATRDAIGVKFTNVLASHELRYGVDVEFNGYDADLSETWYRFFGPASSAGGSYIQERSYFVQGRGTTTNTAWFVQDSWRIAPNVRLNLGLRYESQRMDSANDVAIAGASDAEACTAHGECRTVGSLNLANNWAPRLGITWDPAKNGRSKVYGFWGRFYEAIPLNINIRAINGERYIIPQYISPVNLTSANWYNPNGSPLANNGPWTVRRTSSLTLTTPLDEDLKTQYQDEFILGGEYQFGTAWSVGARYVDRPLRRIIEDIGTFTDPSDPIALTGYVIGNPGEGFFGAPFEKPKRTYRALEFTVQKALRNNWQLYSSFVYASAKGNHEGLYMSGYDQLDPNINALYDIPSFIPNADGKMRADKPYQFKMHSAYTFDWGLTISEGFLLSAGVPISAQGPEIVNGYGDGTIFLQPRGSEGRTPTFWNFDFHADYKLPFFGTGNARSLSVILDVFNLFNNHETLEVDQDYIYEGMENFDPWTASSNLDAYGNPKYNSALPASGFYKTPILFQTPRSVQFGVKFTF
jgi:outer membrane receptor protein involved in Fe transport